MPTYSTPGVYIEEISKFPPSVAAVETAVPAFIGYTEKTTDSDGNSIVNVPIRITSLLEFEQIFGKAPVHAFSLNVVQTLMADTGQITETVVSHAGTPPTIPARLLYYSMQLFFANGGGKCYVVSTGDLAAAVSTPNFSAAINALEGHDEPTLLVFPDAVLVSSNLNYGTVVGDALSHCAKLQDRFTISDVRNAVPTGTEDDQDVGTDFRDRIPTDLNLVKYGAAYFPYVKTQLAFYTNDDNVAIASHTVNSVAANGTVTPGAGSIAAATAISDSTVRVDENAVYNAAKTFVSNVTVTLPPSGAVAGAYARTDRTRGVWQAPANVSLLRVSGPAINITNTVNDGLNIDAGAGKSVNAIRFFTGKGTLIWGARTLAGNDNENRYVPVRRFLIFAEESIKKATGAFVFEPNDANTWTKVRTMIENFLIIQWRDGALAGAKPEDAFYVSVGLNKTMSAQDILDGYMIVEIGLAIVRPAEFIVLRFVQKMQES